MPCLYKRLIYATLLLFLGGNLLISQNNQLPAKDYLWFDSMVGVENAGLYLGKEYTEQYRMYNGNHKFFESFDFQKGTIMYHGQPFFDVLLKLDLYDNEVLVNLPSQEGVTIFQLLKDKIEKFTLGDHEFVKIIQKSIDSIPVSGFEEVLLSTSQFQFLKKQWVVKESKLQDTYTRIEFSPMHRYSLILRNVYYPINKKKDVLRIFPEFKNALKAYPKLKRGNDEDDYMLGLLTKLHAIMDSSKVMIK